MEDNEWMDGLNRFVLEMALCHTHKCISLGDFLSKLHKTVAQVCILEQSSVK